MNRDMVLAEWQRATRSLRAAELLTREGYHEDAVSRAYYAILHVAKAALFVHDVAATSHAAVRRLFGQHLIRTGEIERQWSSHLGESLDDRLAAAYDGVNCGMPPENFRSRSCHTERLMHNYRENQMEISIVVSPNPVHPDKET